MCRDPNSNLSIQGHPPQPMFKLRLPRHPFLLLLIPLLPLPLQELSLLLCTHSLQLLIPSLLSLLVSLHPPLLRLLHLVDFTQLAYFFLPRRAQLSEHFGAVVGVGSECVGETEEVVEYWQGAVVSFRGRMEAEG